MESVFDFILLMTPIVVVVLFASGKQKPWNKLTAKEKKRYIVFLIFGLLVFFVGLVVALLN